MGQQGSFGGNKPGGAPNPNYGSGTGTDNSNGVYNASASLQAAQQPAQTYEQGLGAGTIGGTADPLASPTLPPPAGVTGTTDPGTAAVGATGAATNPNGAAFSTATRAGKGQGKGMTPQAPAGMQGAATTLNGALAGGPTGQPPAYSTSYVPPPPATTAAPGASSPMSGSSLTVGDALGQGKSAKGGLPAAPAGVGGQSGGQTGVAGATGTTAPGATGSTGPIDYAAQSGRFNAQNDPTGGYAKMYNQQQASKAAVTNAPSWMKGLFSGVDQFGGTLQQRSDASGRVDNGPTTKDWQSVVKKMTGQGDAWSALQTAYDTANKAGDHQAAENIHRALLGSGIDQFTANRVHEMFTSGTDKEGAARRLGLTDEYLKRTGATQAQKDQAKELADWHKANPTATVPPPGATGATGSPDAGGPTGVTGPPGPPPPDITQPPPGTGVVTPAEAKATPGLTNDRVNQIARQYMVSPEIAKQIYMQILQQSQSSGGGGGPGGSGGDGGDGGGDE